MRRILAVYVGSANVLSSDLDTLNIWLTPFSEYQVRVRQELGSGAKTVWSAKSTVAARGLVNSFENYAILNRDILTS